MTIASRAGAKGSRGGAKAGRGSGRGGGRGGSGRGGGRGGSKGGDRREGRRSPKKDDTSPGDKTAEVNGEKTEAGEKRKRAVEPDGGPDAGVRGAGVPVIQSSKKTKTDEAAAPAAV